MDENFSRWLLGFWFLETLIELNETLWFLKNSNQSVLMTHWVSSRLTKTIHCVLVSFLCNFCMHMSQSEQPCRVSWVPSEASSWAECEHKWCFHSALLSAVWILPRALISMAAAFSLIPGLCYRRTHMHTRTLADTHALLLAPPSQLQLNSPVCVPFL